LARARQAPARAQQTVVIPRYFRYISIAVLTATLALAVYHRLYPLLNTLQYGYYPYLDELDPYEAYYVVNYMLQHGPLSYFDLRPPNPAVMIFWYPWGRDFLTTELPGLIYTIYLTYIPLKLLGVDLMTYMVLFPVIATAASLIGIYLVSKELSGSTFAALTSTAFFAFLFTDRTIAGFTVKYTMALAILPYALYTFVKAYRSMKPLYFLIHGLVVAYMALSSGLYIGVLAISCLTMIIYPLVTKKVEPRSILANAALMVLPSILVFISYPMYGISYLYKSVGAVTLLTLFLLALRYYIIPVITPKKANIAYLATIIVIGAAGVALISIGHLVGGKVAQALGITHVLGTLSFTIAEYQPTNPSFLMSYYGVLVMISILSLLYALYLLAAKRDLIALYVSVLTLGTLYVLENLSYFTSFAALILSISSSYFLGFLASTVSSRLFSVRRRRSSSLAPILSIVLLTTLISAQAYVAYSYHIPPYRYHLPMVLTSGIGLTTPNTAWLDALRWIRENTPSDSVVVSWWDYGYWISVLGQRASVADGATINGTQIEILAKILTSRDAEAAKLLIQNFRVVPNKTYVLVYDTFVATPNYVYPINNADAAKAISAILRIAGYDIDADIYGNNPRTAQYIGSGPQKYVKIVSQGQQISLRPNWESPSIQNMLLFRIMINGIYTAFPGTIFYSADPSAGGNFVDPADMGNMTYFKPAAIFKSAITSVPGAYDIYVIVFIYQLVGAPE